MRSNFVRWLLVGLALILVGAALMGICGGKQLFLLDTKITRHGVEASFRHISVSTRTADLKLVPTEDDTALVICREYPNTHHAITVENDTLKIEFVDEREWYEHIGLFARAPKLTVYLPEAIYGDVRIALSTGDVEVEDIHCESLRTESTTGDVGLERVTAEGLLFVECTTGDVEFSRIDGAELRIETSTGDIKGSVRSDKTFAAQTSTGDVRIPRTTGEPCQLTTTTGDISVTVETGMDN